MARKNMRRPDVEVPLDPDRLRRGVEHIHMRPDGDWLVRNVPASTKVYRCPGCDQEIPPGTGHVVAWPADGRGDLADRRHWHTACWAARDRRGPTGRR